MKQYQLAMPQQVYSGETAMQALETLASGHEKAAVFTDAGIRASGILERPLAELDKAAVPYIINDTLPAEPTCDQAQQVIDTFRESNADLIVAVGGGSVMDIAKLASITADGSCTVRDQLKNPRIGKKTVTTVMIPTTAGTGSEATPNSIVAVPEEQLKVGIVNPEMIADAVILDGNMIRRLPRKIAASTGIDALCHAIECYTSAKANPFSDLFAMQALRLIFRNLEKACDDPDALDAKEKMMQAAFYAGVAITCSGTTAVHALSYPLGGRYHIPHGVANAIMLMPVMQFNKSCCIERFAEVYEAVGGTGARNSAEKADWVIAKMDAMVQHLDIDDNPDYKALVTDKDGHIYGLCKETPIFADLIGYRVDQFKAAGIDPDSIVTIDDFTKALETLKAYYGKDNPNYYPLTGRDTAIRFASWFGAASNISSTESHGIYINGHYKDGSIDIMNDGAYKMVETMKKWYAEGLIQPEWVAGTFGEADWEAAMLNGNGSVFFDYYNRAEWFMENGGPDNDPNYQMGVLNFIKDDNGNPQKMPVSMKYNDECVTAINANCSEDKIKTILTFIDYFYSEEGEILANYGVEGESFKDTNGDKEFIVDYQTEEATPAGEKRWSFLSDRFTVCKPVDNEAFFKWNAPLIAEATGRLFTDENLGTSYVLKFTDDQSKEVTNLLASVYDAQMSGIAQFIDGTRELTPDNWAAFQQEMNDLGLSRIEEIQLAAYQAMYGA